MSTPPPLPPPMPTPPPLPTPALAALATAVRSYEPYLQASGEMTDPVIGSPTQYGTPYHAFCHAILAAHGPADARDHHTGAAVRGLDAALRHAADPRLPATIASIRRDTGASTAGSHRDFFWPPILKTYRLLAALGHPAAPAFAERIAAVDILASFHSRPPSNWAMVWVSGEWLRMRLGLSPTTPAAFDDWLGAFFTGPVLLERGLYQEPGHPNSYDLFTRYHMADTLMEGYAGAWRPQLEHLMETGLRRSLAVQLSDGSLASAHRSTGQTWNLGAQCAYFTHVAAFFHTRDPLLARQAEEAATLAFASFTRWQRPAGPYSPVENLLPPPYRVGYEGYTADGHYGNLAMGFLAGAIHHGFTGATPAGTERPALVHIEGDPTYRALAHHGRYSVHVNALPAPHYDGFGITDLTFGPGRLLQFASSVRHLSAPTTFYNLGLALRTGAGLAEIRPIAGEPMALIGEIEGAPSGVGLRLRSRAKGMAWTYALEVTVDQAGVRVVESTPGRVGHATLLVPYVRDCGAGVTTVVSVEGATVRLQLGAEVVRIEVEGGIERALDLPYGYENRRGLCGLLRLDIAGACAGIRYRVVVER